MSRMLTVTITFSLALCLSCSDRQSSNLEPVSSTTDLQVSYSGVDEGSMVVVPAADSDDALVDSVLAELIKHSPDKDPADLRLIAEATAMAMNGEGILLSKFEIPSLPAPEDRDPAFGYMTWKVTKKDPYESYTWYFAIPSCLCGTVINEEKYMMDEGTVMRMCGCR